MGKPTRLLSKTVTRYLPWIAIALSLYGSSHFCDIVVVFVTVLPYLLIGIASFTNVMSRKTRFITLLLYIEVSLLILIKYEKFSIR